jgi:hypothetical protein
MSCERIIGTFARCLQFIARSENRASRRKWWFTREDADFVFSKKEGLTDSEALKWLLEENTRGMQRLREKLMKLDQG